MVSVVLEQLPNTFVGDGSNNINSSLTGVVSGSADISGSWLGQNVLGNSVLLLETLILVVPSTSTGSYKYI